VGVTVGPDGGSHQALEDIALMRVLPRMTVISPCDALETEKAVIASANTDGPVYIRLVRDKIPVITAFETPFRIGKAQIFREERHADAVIIATGEMVYHALKAARRLSIGGRNISVMNLATVKPLDETAVTRIARECGAVVTAEDHQLAGGMGSAVAECLARTCPVPIEFVAVPDRFGQSGKSGELLKAYGLGENDIEAAVLRAIVRKR
jgi:transketolase